MIVATAGHVDHGKTALVRQLTGIDTDRLEEEKSRGLTIDLGFAYTNIADARVGFIDVPGHIRFIHNMLAGVSAIDLALIVVAADDGVMPQTIEHLTILELLEIPRGIIAISKIDRVDGPRIDEVRQQVEALTEGTRFAGAPVYPLSGQTGDGVEALRDALALAAREARDVGPAAGFRLAVDRAFVKKGAGLVVTGSVFSGEVREGDELALLPAGLPVRVRAIHRQNEQSTQGARGDRLALNLSGPGIDRDHVARGHWVTALNVPSSDRIDARVRIAPGSPPLRHWTPVHVHTAATHVTGRVATLDARHIEPGSTGLVQIVLNEPINAWREDRLVLRDQAAEITLGGGTVIDPAAPAKGRARRARREVLEVLTRKPAADRIRGMLEVSAEGFDWAAFKRAETALPPKLDEALANAGGVAFGNGMAISSSRLESVEAGIKASITAWLDANPDRDGLSERDVHTLDSAPGSAALIEHVLDRLVAAGALEHKSGVLRRVGQQIRLGDAEEKLWQKVQPILSRDPTRPPVLHDLAKEIGLPPAAVEKLLMPCVKAGLVVRPVQNRFFLPGAMAELLEKVEAAASAGNGTFTVKDYRDATGIGRNLCIEILEYFDRTGKTVRQGDNRMLRKERAQ